MDALLDPLDPTWLVNLVNEYGSATRAAATEQDAPFPELRDLENAPGIALSCDDSELAATADRLFPVFAAAPDPEATARALDEILDRASVRVTAEALDGTVGKRFVAKHDPSPLSTAAALTVLDLVEAVGVDRIGTCRAERCVDVFIDRSPEGNRSYCSQTCQTRERVARHRRRHSS